MWKRRIAWGVIIICAAILYLFDNGTASLALLICCILVPVGSLALLAAAGGNVQAELVPVDEFDHAKAGGSLDAAAEIVVRNKGRLPLGKTSVRVNCRNLRTGQSEQVEIQAEANRRETRTPLKLEMPHVGRHEIRLEESFVADALGLARRRIPTEGAVDSTKYPEVFPIQVRLASSAAVMLESDRYANRRSGNDPGEVREIREYVPGDPVRNIHWKLSEKTDKLLVKELGLPVTDQMMVLLDTAAPYSVTGNASAWDGPAAGAAGPSEPPSAADPKALDIIASVYMSLLQALTGSGYEFTAGWIDGNGQPLQRKITMPAQIAEAADSFLAAPPDSGSLLRQIETVRTENRFSHLVIVGAQIPAGIEEIAGGAQVTLLLHGWGSEVREGMSIIGYDAGNYQQELAGIEI